jgi:hypothetical protein
MNQISAGSISLDSTFKLYNEVPVKLTQWTESNKKVSFLQFTAALCLSVNDVQFIQSTEDSVQPSSARRLVRVYCIFIIM